MTKKVAKARKIKFQTMPFNVNIVREEDGELCFQTEEFVELEGVIHLNGDVTVVVLEDESKGITTKGDKDAYDEEIGIEVAFWRAYIQHIEKHIKEISGPRIF